MRRKRFRKLLVFGLLGLSIASTILLFASRPEPPAEDIPDKLALVDTLDLVPETVQFEVPTQGTVQPAAQTQITAEVSGTIVSVAPEFVAGGAFNKGAVLIQIDPTLFKANVAQAEAIVRQRQAEYDGIKRLDAKNYRSKIDLAGAEAALASAKADLVRARNDLTKSSIRLPYAGIVRARNADVGQFVAPGTVLGTAFSSERAEVRLPLSQTDLGFLNLPDTGSATADGQPVTLTGRYRGRPATWSARIVRTEATIDETNRITYAVASIDDPYRRNEGATEQPLPIGTFVGADIVGVAMDNVLAFPRSALYGSGRLVFVDNESQLRLRDVELIRSTRDLAYIDADTVDERRIVLTRLETPVNGQSVRVAGDDNDARAGTSTTADTADPSAP